MPSKSVRDGWQRGMEVLGRGDRGWVIADFWNAWVRRGGHWREVASADPAVETGAGFRLNRNGRSVVVSNDFRDYVTRLHRQ